MGSQANLASISAAFEGKTLLVTGANGFFGQAVSITVSRDTPADNAALRQQFLERFLSGPFKPAKIYCLIRAPLTPSRLPAHLSGPNFPFLEWIAGDPAEPLLGLEPEKYWELLGSVNIVINGAANTKFTQSRMDSVGSNVGCGLLRSRWHTCRASADAFSRVQVTIAFQIASFAYSAQKLSLLVHLSTTCESRFVRLCK